MKRFLTILAALCVLAACGGQKKAAQKAQGSTNPENIPSTASAVIPDAPTVYFTSDISPEGRVKIYEALGVKASGRVGVKISTGESSKSNYLRPAFIKDLVDKVDGTLIECNTAYGGNRMSTADHRKAIAERGFDQIAKVDIMDEEGEMQIPVVDKKHIQYDIVGTHIANYDFVINLAHFKGHAMGGFGGVLKNQSIGFASTHGKFYIHSAGESSSHWITAEQDAFLESMAAAAQAVHNYFKQDGKDIGILASTDPVALDKACLDLVFGHVDTTGDDAKPLQQRINRQHGTHIIDYAVSIGLGTDKYNLKNID